ncbi:uncharacterized protein LOC134530632 isoform X2 [Bacillus rossius redtenbacheri]|uniref:uncharacterized protein LOC134530632 isoform X2 n=1 Tax=Bacillus rossius redtenbacheri TaxID=93214 RepID=UPI002FDD4524
MHRLHPDYRAMKAVVLVTAVALAAAGCPPYDELGRTVYLPHPHDCARFLRCEAGSEVPGLCPQGLHFSPAALVCAAPAAARCAASPPACSRGAPLARCRYHCTCGGAGVSSCPAELQFPAQLLVFSNLSSCTTGPEDIAVSATKLGRVATSSAAAQVALCAAGRGTRGGEDRRHYADCAAAVRCEGAAQAVLRCPQGLLYDSDLGVCGDPASVDCGPAPAPPGGCPTAQPLSSCRFACDCHQSHGRCPAQLQFRAVVNITDTRTHPDCLKDPSLISMEDRYRGRVWVERDSASLNPCPASSLRRVQYVADPLECGRMFRCSRGRARAASCPVGLHYDPRALVCRRGAPRCQHEEEEQEEQEEQEEARPLCPAAGTCPAAGGRLAHLSDCSLFCECERGAPLLVACPPGQHFSPQAQACTAPETAGCITQCPRLAAVDGGRWEPAGCDAADSDEGAECRLACDADRQLVGSAVINCTARGWNGSGGLNLLPSCNTTEQVAKIILNKINQTMTAIKEMDQKAGMLFVLDESGSVTEANFQIEKDFVEALVNAFPLSQNRSAGVITFSGPGEAAVDIGLRQTSTCDFLDELKKVAYSGGFTDMAGALSLAKDEIDYSAAGGNQSITLIFAITDGQSQSDPADAARLLRDSGHTLFAIGVASYDRAQLEPLASTYKDGSKLFFGLPNFQVFQVVAEYLKTTYKNNVALTCT